MERDEGARSAVVRRPREDRRMEEAGSFESHPGQEAGLDRKQPHVEEEAMKGIQGILHQIEARYIKGHKADFKPGDTVKISLKVVEGEKERIQMFEGTVIGRSKSGIQETFRVRRVSY